MAVTSLPALQRLIWCGCLWKAESVYNPLWINWGILHLGLGLLWHNKSFACCWHVRYDRLTDCQLIISPSDGRRLNIREWSSCAGYSGRCGAVETEVRVQLLCVCSFGCGWRVGDRQPVGINCSNWRDSFNLKHLKNSLIVRKQTETLLALKQMKFLHAISTHTVYLLQTCAFYWRHDAVNALLREKESVLSTEWFFEHLPVRSLPICFTKQSSFCPHDIFTFL